MYSSLPSFVLGFHGCDKSVADKVISGKAHLNYSKNSYDWLGNGIYFWENNPQRALEYAQSIKKHPERCQEKITKPDVIGAVIDLGHCLNLLDSKNLKVVKQGYALLKVASRKNKVPLPENISLDKKDDLLLRKLDCAVIETVHAFNEFRVEEYPDDKTLYLYDTVRGAFWEGKELYPNAGFKESNHIQICVRNLNCIKGYFRVKNPTKDYRIP